MEHILGTPRLRSTFYRMHRFLESAKQYLYYYIRYPIHCVDGNHWITSTSIGEVTMYDSKFRDGDLSTFLAYQLALVYCTLITVEEDGEVEPDLVIHIPLV